MFVSFKLNRRIILLCLSALLLSAVLWSFARVNTASKTTSSSPAQVNNDENPQKAFIKWVDFKVTANAMQQAMQLDIESQHSAIRLNWIELLSILGAQYGGDFSKFREADLKALADRFSNGESYDAVTKDMKYCSYYLEAYNAVLGEYVGSYEIQQKSNNSKSLEAVQKYGLKAFSPIASGYAYSHYDDFGASRSYGYKRKYLGHDIFGNVGTPVIAVESGTVEAIGWNRYGGWRIGIRSFDQKRYYYYAHLRKNHPYPEDLSIGHTVKAGDVIGYLGMTGYSTTENTNNIDTPHLHLGIQLIFDSSQKEGNGEIWIDCYEISKFLAQNASAVTKDELTNEYRRKYEFMEASTENTE